jgi:hypothetical protein
LESIRQTASREIQNDADLPNQQARDAAQQLLDGLFEGITKTVQAGTVDGALAVNLAPGSLTALIGARVSEGAQLEELLKKLDELAKEDAAYPGINFNADEHAGVQLHTMDVELPEGEQARQVFGDQLNLVVGTGPSAAYFAAGKEALAQLKNAIDRSASADDATVPAFRLKVSVGQVVRFIASVEPNPIVASLAKDLESSAGTDNLLVLVGKSDDAVSYRIELQQGVLQAIGQGVQAAQAAQAQNSAGF